VRSLFLLLVACASAPPAAHPTRFYSGDGQGLREVGSDGRPLRGLTTTPTRSFRALPDGTVVFVVAAGDDALAPIEVRAIRVDGSHERVLARIEPTVLCGAEVDYILGQHRDEDLWTAEDGAVCLKLTDEAGAAPELVQVHRFDPHDGGHSEAFVKAPPGCPPVAPRDPCR
jgi:hypothetical protein